MGSVILKNVSKSFDDTKIIRDVSLEIPEGKFCVLVGPSGCGKSTLLRLIAGLEDVTGGQVYINGQDVTEQEPKLRDIAMVFQSYALYPQMTVRENMGFALKLSKMPKKTINQKVDDVAALLGLEKLLDRLPKELSGGQRQRVAMGRAIVRNPQVFLFDEPLSNLDAKLRTQVRAEIRELHQRLHTTSVYVTHDQIEAMTMGEMIVVLRDGVIEQSGTPLELYDRPANRFVASFIGSPEINQISAWAIERDGRLMLQLDEHTVLPVPEEVSVVSGQQIVYAVRPEQFDFVEDPQGAIAAQVDVIENTGSDVHIFCLLSDRRRITISQKQRLALKQGDQVYLRPKENAVHIFDQASGQRLNK
ncbi:sn-glycerol-3-phosphate ABC transporter ATP-binding protein UgpC [Pectobacteriaceae bacterium CE70]|uniref:sn-glycerol-3-phosphate ABC transporter ATP-binding protein UgpC n=1 Tax=Serratia sp. (strain ATCC 39006) TaxID=104623 RepID=A0A2I5TGW7_SERS3|nr:MULTISPECIES: sn-glycerol-3-phosphate ABC transporter ATP-binding protein UgpC [Enterobacterales]WJV61934.1 sn-glycerol-3-phosphate ABC transporter ATP-binding protein UgpC [Pectobacteriaceae bacterium C52]WJV66205.1 sn-glycerol-3-phosphate ABC transporter ATP-binding protein UgpC [Pectobacteriaceae bacterium CE70]WJY10214.1 sn-glycerol-3-phosphate ABC transporter ATP-binding protein UgpC [Pectobacteriaceae bacterium C80]AUG99478.1 sn-glycerol-3-phosphate ABC transporter ATP-binding protein 